MRRAAALAARQGPSIADDPAGFVAAVAARTPPGPIQDGVSRAAALPVGTSIAQAARAVGNGSRVIALDTVPLCVWAAARFARSLEDALWQTVSVGGDLDTTCAIVGGVVALTVGRQGLPPAWLAAREPLPWHLGR